MKKTEQFKSLALGSLVASTATYLAIWAHKNRAFVENSLRTQELLEDFPAEKAQIVLNVCLKNDMIGALYMRYPDIQAIALFIADAIKADA